MRESVCNLVCMCDVCATICTCMCTGKLTFDFGWFLDDMLSLSDYSLLDTPPLSTCPILD